MIQRRQAYDTPDDHPIVFLARTTQMLRERLWAFGFMEIPTPVVRKHDCCSVAPRVKLADGRFLRESSSHALRRNLAHYSKIFEVAPSFRLDDPDKTHLQEFLMLDLYKANSNLQEMVDFAVNLVSEFYSVEFFRLSLGQHILKDLDVDCFQDAQWEQKLLNALERRYPHINAGGTLLLDTYIKAEIEPRSVGSGMILEDFPCLAEGMAKPRRDTAGIADSAEVIMDGVEVVQIYEDDPDVDGLLRRGARYGHVGPEEHLIANLIRSGEVPAQSAGFGIGIERLCRACLGLDTISSFVSSPEFTAHTSA